MIRRFTILFFQLLPFFFIAQNSKIDSLNNLLKKETSSLKKANLLSKIGNNYFVNQIYLDSAFYYTEKAYVLAKEENSALEQSRALFNLGNISNSILNYKQAINYFTQAIEILEKEGEVNKVGSALNNLGISYFEMGDYNKAIESYQKALDIALINKDTFSMAVDYMNIGEAYYKLNRLEESKKILKKSLDLINTTDQNPPTVHLFYARTLEALNEIEASKNEANMAYEIANENNNLFYTAASSELLSRLHFKSNDFEKAYFFQQNFQKLNDSLNTAKERNEVEKLKLNFELNKKEEELNYILEKNKYQNIIYILAGIGVLLLVILIFRQKKIMRMTGEIHNIQKRLVEQELEKRDLVLKNKNASGFDAARAQDHETDL